MTSPPRLRLIKGGLPSRPAALESANVESDLRRRLRNASTWLPEEQPRSRRHLVVI